MRILEGKCPHCFGNLVLSEQGYTITCEDCKATSTATAKHPDDLVRLLLHCDVVPRTTASLKELWIILKTRSLEYGPEDQRQILTPAGVIIVRSYDEGEEVRGDEIMDLVEASRGLITDPEKVKKLKEGGFIL